MFSFSTQVSQSYVTTGLTNVLYIRSLEFSVNTTGASATMIIIIIISISSSSSSSSSSSGTFIMVFTLTT